MSLCINSKTRGPFMCDAVGGSALWGLFHRLSFSTQQHRQKKKAPHAHGEFLVIIIIITAYIAQAEKKTLILPPYFKSPAKNRKAERMEWFH